jgi:hypothetical protein
MSVCELKLELSSLLGVPVSQQQLYSGVVRLPNKKLLDDYNVFSPVGRKLSLHLKQSSAGVLRLYPNMPGGLTDLLTELNAALTSGLVPSLTLDGTGGTYLLKNMQRGPRAIFKPLDEEAFAPHNPRSYCAPLGTPGFRAGVLSGEAGYREVAAYLSDSNSTRIVPLTGLVDLTHSSLNYPPSTTAWAKTGSLQQFIENKGSCEDFSSTLFPQLEVQKVALLDLRILNMDRNEGNLLVTKTGPNYALVPIDHGMTFPDCFDISVEDLCWFSWPQVKEPIHPELLALIERIDPVNDICMLKRLFPFRDVCLKNFRIAAILLKKCAKAGLTLHQIAKLLCRPSFEDSVSAVERTVQKAEELYHILRRSQWSMFPTKILRHRAQSETNWSLA